MSQLWHNPHVYNSVNYQCLKHLNYQKCFLNQYNFFSCNWHLQGFQTSVIETLNWKSRLSDAIFLDTSLISVPDSAISAICQPPWLCCLSLSPAFCLSNHFRHLSASYFCNHVIYVLLFQSYSRKLVSCSYFLSSSLDFSPSSLHRTSNLSSDDRFSFKINNYLWIAASWHHQTSLLFHL